MRREYETYNIKDIVIPQDLSVFIGVGARDHAFRMRKGLWLHSDDGTARSYVYPHRQVTLLPVETVRFYDDDSRTSNITQVPIFNDFYNYENAPDPFRYSALEQALPNGTTLLEEKVVAKNNEESNIWTYSYRWRLTQEGQEKQNAVKSILDEAAYHEFMYNFRLGNNLGEEYYDGDELAWKFQSNGTQTSPTTWKDSEYIFYKDKPMYVGVGVGRYFPEQYEQAVKK